MLYFYAIIKYMGNLQYSTEKQNLSNAVLTDSTSIVVNKSTSKTKSFVVAIILGVSIPFFIIFFLFILEFSPWSLGIIKSLLPSKQQVESQQRIKFEKEEQEALNSFIELPQFKLAVKPGSFSLKRVVDVLPDIDPYDCRSETYCFLVIDDNNVYIIYHLNRDNTYVTKSSDNGAHWQTPLLVSKGVPQSSFIKDNTLFIKVADFVLNKDNRNVIDEQSSRWYKSNFAKNIFELEINPVTDEVSPKTPSIDDFNRYLSKNLQTKDIQKRIPYVLPPVEGTYGWDNRLIHLDETRKCMIWSDNRLRKFEKVISRSDLTSWWQPVFSYNYSVFATCSLDGGDLWSKHYKLENFDGYNIKNTYYKDHKLYIMYSKFIDSNAKYLGLIPDSYENIEYKIGEVDLVYLFSNIK